MKICHLKKCKTENFMIDRSVVYLPANLPKTNERYEKTLNLDLEL